MSLWVAWEKDTDRMCPSSPRQTRSSNLNHTASQLYLKLQVNRGVYCEWRAKDFKSVLSLLKIWNRCLNSCNNSVILSLYWFTSLFSPVVRTLFTQRKLAVSSLESCVSHEDNFNLDAHMVSCRNTVWQVFCGLATYCSDYSSAVYYPPESQGLASMLKIEILKRACPFSS